MRARLSPVQLTTKAGPWHRLLTVRPLMDTAKRQLPQRPTAITVTVATAAPTVMRLAAARTAEPPLAVSTVKLRPMPERCQRRKRCLQLASPPEGIDQAVPQEAHSLAPATISMFRVANPSSRPRLQEAAREAAVLCTLQARLAATVPIRPARFRRRGQPRKPAAVIRALTSGKSARTDVLQRGPMARVVLFLGDGNW